MINPKSLLMPLSTSGHVPERIKGALSVAKFFNAHLEVLHAQVSPSQFLPREVVGMPDSILQQLESVAGSYSKTESQKLQALFESLCAELGVNVSDDASSNLPNAHWQEVNGLRSELVAERGKVADMIIIPQSKSGKPSSTFEAAIMRSGKPVLLVPRVMTEFKVNKTIIAWNGSTEVARAVTHALPLLKKADEVVLATSYTASVIKPGLDEVQAYLEIHGVKASTTDFDSSHGPTGRAILDLAHEKQSDLIVMGAFTHRRVHEQIFGGVTQYMMGHSDLPILMMH
ncbi:MAG: universal stress protein [Neptuniibacter sp.]